MQCWRALFWVLSGEPLVFAGEKRAFNIPSQTFIGVFWWTNQSILCYYLTYHPTYILYLVYLVTIEHQWAVSPVVNGSRDSNSLTLSIPPSDGSQKHRSLPGRGEREPEPGGFDPQPQGESHLPRCEWWDDDWLNKEKLLEKELDT